MDPRPPSPDRDATPPRAADATSYPFLSPTDRPGELGRLGPYRVIRLLGAGGMGFVFRAEDDALRRPVALKVMRPELACQQVDRERFLHEGRAAAAVKSDYVITIYGVGEANGAPFLAMEFLEGLSLEDWLKARKKPITASAIVRVAKDTLRGLVAVHKQNLIHRDVKPANLWVESAGTGRITLLDFGITRPVGDDLNLTRPGAIVGTPAYMAPEQARGLKVDGRTDLFSLGAVLVRMLMGRSPFERETLTDTLIALATEELPPATSFGILPAEMAKLIDHLVAKDPNRRPQTAAEALGVVQEAERKLVTLHSTPSVMLSISPLPAESIQEFEYVIKGQRKTGKRKVVVLEIGGGQTMSFVRIEKGNFLMGAAPGEFLAEPDETPQRRVELSRDFYLGMYAVTQAQYRAVMGQSPSAFKGDLLPVESVSWEDAVAFCERLTDRTKQRMELPTEAQWEYACRAGTTTPFHFGLKLNGDLANQNGNQPYGTEETGPYKETTVEVGSYPANPWGLYDMHGNVWEWCRDYYGPYDKVVGLTDPFQATKQVDFRRVLRGGSWSNLAWLCRAAFRRFHAPDSRDDDAGFRVCLRLD